MPDFQKIEQEAKEAAQGHSSQVDEAMTRGEQEVDQRIGQEHADQVQKAGDAMEKELGIAQPEQSGNPAS
jgi:hypothetical protein